MYSGALSPASRAAVEVAQELGIAVDKPVLIQETSNTVVWLRPYEIIAKVASRADSVKGLVREHELATALAGLGAPVAQPFPGSAPVRHGPSGLLVTLWCRLERDTAAALCEVSLGLATPWTI